MGKAFLPWEDHAFGGGGQSDVVVLVVGSAFKPPV